MNEYTVTTNGKAITVTLKNSRSRIRDRFADALMGILYSEYYFDFTGKAQVSSQGETRHYEVLPDGRVLIDFP